MSGISYLLDLVDLPCGGGGADYSGVDITDLQTDRKVHRQ